MITMTEDPFNSTAYIAFQGVLDYDNAWSTIWVPNFCAIFMAQVVQKNQETKQLTKNANIDIPRPL